MYFIKLSFIFRIKCINQFIFVEMYLLLDMELDTSDNNLIFAKIDFDSDFVSTMTTFLHDMEVVLMGTKSFLF